MHAPMHSCIRLLEDGFESSNESTLSFTDPGHRGRCPGPEAGAASPARSQAASVPVPGVRGGGSGLPPPLRQPLREDVG